MNSLPYRFRQDDSSTNSGLYVKTYSIPISFWVLNALLIILLIPLTKPSTNALWLALLAQALCSICYIASPKLDFFGELRCVGAFHFVYQGFFLARPLYIIIESEHKTNLSVFGLQVSDELLFESILYSAMGLMFFQLGILAHDLFIQRQKIGNVREKFSLKRKNFRISKLGIAVLFGLEFILLVSAYILSLLAGGNSVSIVSFVGLNSAYIYMLPVVASGISASILILISSSKSNMILKFTFFFMHILYQLAIQNFSQFRIDYMSGLMIGMLGIFHLHRRRQVSGTLFFGFLLLSLPLVRVLGRSDIKSLALPVLSAVASFVLPILQILVPSNLLEPVSTLSDLDSDFQWQSYQIIFNLAIDVRLKSYWHFFDLHGDFNIFDTFARGIESVQNFHLDKTYIVSWIYIFLHWVPRQIWTNKPPQGMLYNQEFLGGLQFSPGIVGTFFLEGGFFWMLFCMFILGLIISRIDSYILKIRVLEHRVYFHAVGIIMAAFLARSSLYPPVYYAAYFIVSKKFIDLITRQFIITCRVSSTRGLKRFRSMT